MGAYDPKPSTESGTFWGVIVGGIVGIFQLVGGVKSGNHRQVGEGALAVVGFFTAWRLRKGFSRPIED